MLGLLRQMRATGDARPVTLVYGNRTEAQIVDRDWLEAQQTDGHLRVVHVLSEPPDDWTDATGMIDGALLKATFAEAGHRDWAYVLCGPPAMLSAVRASLRDMGVPDARIISEAFVYD